MFLSAVLAAISALPTMFADLAALFTAVSNLFHSPEGQTIAQAARAAVADAEKTYQPLATAVNQNSINIQKREFAVNALTGMKSITVPEHKARVAVEMAVAEAKQAAKK